MPAVTPGARFADVRDEHPEWADQEASVAFVFEGNPGAYTSQDLRSRVLADLGFSIPSINDSERENSAPLLLTPGDLDPLDVGVLVWVYGSEGDLDTILNGLPQRESLDVVEEGREVFVGPAAAAAFAHASPLSLDFVLGALVPEIDAAADGDTGTPVPSAIEVGASEPIEESVIAASAWARVFDSTATFTQRSRHLASSDELAPAGQAFAEAGASFGGIRLVPNEVVVDGVTATVTYDVIFGENVAFSGRVGRMSQFGGVWTVSQTQFCAVMTSLRVNCP